MKLLKLTICLLLLYASTGLYARQTAIGIDSVNALKKNIENLHFPGLEITDVRFIATGSYTPKSTGKELAGLPAFCLVAATLRPAERSEIKIEVWMPQNNWNGRLLGTGNGGGAGNIIVASLAGGIKQGYVTVNTDMGTSRGGANGAVDNPEVWADFGYRATHLMTVAAKAILKTCYGKAQHHAYFVGCSTGGQQALMEAQRFPDDYNGIIAGAPANNRTHLHTGFLWNHLLTTESGQNLFTDAQLSFISRKIIAAYAAQSGGAPGDHFISDPRMVKIDFNKLFQCKGDGKDTCLSTAQIAALKKIYNGPANPRTAEQIYTSPPVGSESVSGGLSYQQSAGGPAGLFYPFKWAFGKDFDARKYDFDKGAARVDSILAPILNANDADLSPMKKLKAKMIMYSGTADPLVPFQDALNYYERVIGQQHGLKQTQDFFRFFLIPGMGHCSGGPGLNGFAHDVLQDLITWVEQDKAPDQIIAKGLTCCDVKVTGFQRPVYPYPKFPKYIGGDVNSPSSYIGVDHLRNSVIKPAGKYLK